VRRWKASPYFSLVLLTTFGGSGGVAVAAGAVQVTSREIVRRLLAAGLRRPKHR